MAIWQVLVPLGSINITQIVTNPSNELGTPPTGYTALAGVITRDSTNQRRGVYAIKDVPAAGVNDGMYWATPSLINGHLYVFSVDIWGASTIPYQITFRDNAGALLGTQSTVVGSGYWNETRLAVAYTTVAGAVHRLSVEKNNSASVAAFWADGWNLVDCTAMGITQAQGLALSYIDGDQLGCYWTGTAHASTSVLRGQSKDGGVWKNFDTDLNTYVESESGIGAPSLANILLPYGQADGSLYQRSRAQARQFILNVNWRNSGAAPTLNNLHTQRKTFLDAVKPDIVSPQQTAWYRYLGTLKPMSIRAAYDSGAEMNLVRDMLFKEQATLRFVAPDPLFYEDGNAASTSTINQSLANANGVIMRSATGVWSAMGTGTSGTFPVVTTVLPAPDGTVYITGQFDLANSVLNTLRIAQWNGTTFVALGTGLQGPGSQLGDCLAMDAAGILYCGGSFTTAGGVANTVSIAKWNGSVWSAMGTGLAGGAATGIGICVGNDGSVYLGGGFTTAGGVANTLNIAKWNGSAWSALGTGANNTVYACVIGSDGNLYIGGTFTTANGVTVNGVAKWNGTTFVALGATPGVAGGSAAVYALAVGPDGALYAGGSFTTAGGVAATNIARWNGTTWSALGSGVTGGANPVYYNGLSWVGSLLYISGTLTSGGGLTPPTSLIIWNGSTYVIPDMVLPGTPSVYKSASDVAGNFYIGFSTAGSATVPANPSFTNSGTAIGHPIFTITGPGTLQQIKNYTTGDTISFNLTLLAGEVVTLNLNPGSISFVSSFRGNILGTILPASSLFTFKLMPGANNISVLINGSTTGATAWTATWRNASLSVDGGAS